MDIPKIDLLLIEDNLPEAGFLKKMLSKAARPTFSVHQVPELAQGLRLLQSRKFDIVLVDLELPNSRGVASAASLRNHSLVTPIIALTGLEDEETARNLLQSDIQDYLVKGEITAPLLLRSIRSAIYRKRQEESARESNQALQAAELQEGKLRESEGKFSKAFQAAPVLFSISSMPEGRYVDVNEEFIRTLGIDRDEVVGRTPQELGIWETPLDRELMLHMLQENKTVRNFETRLRGRGGSLVIGLISAEIIEIKGVEHLLAITKDITELRKAEEERSRLALIVESSDDGIIGKTPEGIITSWNNGAQKIYGYHAREVTGKHISILAPADQPDEVPQILEKVRRGESIERLETTRVRKDGKTIEVSLTMSPISDQNGVVVGASTIARDITERKLAEQVIAQLNASLAARADELETANRDLEAFNYTVAHDLRRPLNVVTSYCQAISALYGDQLPQECQDYVQGAYDGALRMNRLIEALLDFSSLARFEPRRETVDLSALALEVAEELKLAEPARQVDFRFADEVTVLGDRNLLRLVLDNLLGNAWKYTALRELALIELYVTGKGGSEAYCVRDNGAGFSAADAELVFAPFQRLPGAEEYRGFGIGLATVERIIKRHGGKVWAQGKPGQGATFCFTLPAHAEAAAPEKTVLPGAHQEPR